MKTGELNRAADLLPAYLPDATIEQRGAVTPEIIQTVVNIALMGVLPPKVLKIDAKQGIVYLENITEEQIEVYKYTRKESGAHNSYSPHLGKRYKVLYQLKKGATSWKVPDRWIYPTKEKGRTNYRNYFKFGVRKSDGTRSDLSILTVLTANSYEYHDGIKIILDGKSGRGMM